MTNRSRLQKYYERDNSYSRDRSLGYHRDFKNQRHKRRSKEKDYLYDDDIFHSKIERVHKILQTMSQEEEMAIGFMVAFSKNPDKILDSIQSPADVDHLIAERFEYAKSQKVENKNWMKEPHVNVSNGSSQNLMQDSIETEFTERKIDSYYTEIMGNSDSKEEDGTDFSQR